MIKKLLKNYFNLISFSQMIDLCKKTDLLQFFHLSMLTNNNHGQHRAILSAKLFKYSRCHLLTIFAPCCSPSANSGVGLSVSQFGKCEAGLSAI